MQKKAESHGKTTEPTKYETELSSAVDNALHAEIREVVQKKFAEGHTALGSNPEAQVHQAHSDAAALSESIIDLVTRSANPSGKPPPIAIARSDVSMASTSSHLGNGGNAPVFSCLSQGTDAAFAPQFLPQCTRRQKSLHASLDIARRTSTPGRP